MKNTTKNQKKLPEVDSTAYNQIPMLGDGFDSRAFPTRDLRESYLKYRWNLQKAIWCSWPRVIFISVWLMAAIGFGVLLVLAKTNPDVAQRIIHFFQNF